MGFVQMAKVVGVEIRVGEAADDLLIENVGVGLGLLT